MDLAKFRRIMKMPVLPYYDKLHCTEVFDEPMQVILYFHPLVNSTLLTWRHVPTLASDV